MATPVTVIRAKFLALHPVMDERLRRLWAGAEASALGDGGIALVAEATGMSRTTVRAGATELRTGVSPRDVVRVRRGGAGRLAIENKVPGLDEALDRLLDPVGDATSPLRWTTKSTRKLARQLAQCGLFLSPQTVAQLLRRRGFRLPDWERARVAAAHLERNTQLAFVNDQVKALLSRGVPVVALTRTAMPAGDTGHRNESQREAHVTVRGEEPQEELGNSVVGSPARGVASFLDHEGVSLPLAVAAIAAWWDCRGLQTYPQTKQLLVIVDDAGDIAFVQQWKTQLQPVVNHIGLLTQVSHLPLATMKWSAIQHQLLCRITETSQGDPSADRQVAVQLVAIVQGRAQRQPGHDLRESSLRASDDPQQRHAADGALLREWNYLVTPDPARRGS